MMRLTCGLGSGSKVGRGSAGGVCAKARWNLSLAIYSTTMACAESTLEGKQRHIRPCCSVQWRITSKGCLSTDPNAYGA
jgi:hypothetical protein